MKIEFATVYRAVQEKYRRRQAQRHSAEARRQQEARERHRDEAAQLRAYTRIAEALVSQGVYMPGATRWTIPIHQIAPDPPRDAGGPQDDNAAWPIIAHVERMTPTWRERGYFAPQQSNLPEIIIRAIEDGSTRWEH